MLAGLLALIGLGFALGLRHGIDWDHIAAITDITSSTVTNKEAEVEGEIVAVAAGGMGMRVGMSIAGPTSKWRESRQGIFLATMYALGHARGSRSVWLESRLWHWCDSWDWRGDGIAGAVARQRGRRHDRLHRNDYAHGVHGWPARFEFARCDLLARELYIDEHEAECVCGDRDSGGHLQPGGWPLLSHRTGR